MNTLDAEDLALYRAGYQPVYDNPHSKTPTEVVPRDDADTRAADRALRRLHDRHRVPVFAVILRRYANAALDEQIVEEAFLDALHRVSFTYAGRSSLRTWLTQVTWNLVVRAIRDAERAERRLAEGTTADDSELHALVAAVLASLDDGVTRDIAARILASALGNRPEPRRVIEARHGLSPKRVRVLEAHTRKLLAAGAKSTALGDQWSTPRRRP